VTPATANVKASAAKISATFDEAMNASTLDNKLGVFTLKMRGSKKPIAIGSVTYDASTRTVTIIPARKLKKGVYTVTLIGGAT
jgi:hypothetical protein